MKNLIQHFATRTARALMVATVVLGAAVAFAAQWVGLGQKQVSDRTDHDVIKVTAERGTFSAVKFAVRGHAVHFKKVVVNYKNGGKEVLELRDVIPAGGETRVIDLNGDNRVIRSIEFWYEAETIGHAGAHVAAFGMR
jgi:hypothetical protein